jgi:hypothetical protein
VEVFLRLERWDENDDEEEDDEEDDEEEEEELDPEEEEDESESESLDELDEEEELSESLEEDDEEEESLDEDDDEEEEEEEGNAARWAARACICCASNLGAFFKCSLNPSVKPPNPIEVKKLMAKRVFLGLSLGKSPEKTSCM